MEIGRIGRRRGRVLKMDRVVDIVALAFRADGSWLC